MLPPVKHGTPYYSTTAIAEHAIKCLKDHARNHAGQPFFSYVAFIVPHFPVMAPAADIARYRDVYSVGWDVIRQERWQRLRELGIVNCDLAPATATSCRAISTRRCCGDVGPMEIVYSYPWDSLCDGQQKFQAAKMAVHAAMVDRMDQEIGRVLDQVRRMGAFDDTLVFFLSDNGADASLIVRGDGNDALPRPVPRGRSCASAPVGPAPATRPCGGTRYGSTKAAFPRRWWCIGPRGSPPTASSPCAGPRDRLRPYDTGIGRRTARRGLERRGRAALARPESGARACSDVAIDREFLFFDHEGNRALRMGNWKIVSAREDNDAWELFDMSVDRCEKVNLVAKHPELARGMEAKWHALETQYRRQAGHDDRAAASAISASCPTDRRSTSWSRAIASSCNSQTAGVRTP